MTTTKSCSGRPHALTYLGARRDGASYVRKETEQRHRLVGSAARGHTNVDYDIKACSSMASQAQATRRENQPTSRSSISDCCSVAGVRRTPLNRPHPTSWVVGEFKPLMGRLEGLMGKAPAAEVGKRKEMTDLVFHALVTRISLVLSRARDIVYEG